jgi:hypothetical protein
MGMRMEAPDTIPPITLSCKPQVTNEDLASEPRTPADLLDR